jgi:putative heme iron utilization protein
MVPGGGGEIMADDSEQAAAAGSDEGFQPEAEARRLLRSSRAGTLATLNGSGDPFASLVTVATAPDGSPLLLLSQLASHTRHLDKDPRVSLLLADSGTGDPLTHSRMTITGKAQKISDPEIRVAAKWRFLAKHPKAALYADFGDFSFWRIAMDQIHLNGGFARAARFPAQRILTPVADAEPLLAAEAGAIAHMNADHADALSLYAQVFAGQPGGAWQVTGIDPGGLDLAFGDRTARIPFPALVTSAGQLRKILVELAKAARAGTASAPREPQ